MFWLGRDLTYVKKSREETSGTGSGVEIIHNDPYTNGPGGNGQYTYKVYHIGSHLPGWLKAILPKSALRVEEEAWNAYPYTKTRYKCPFVEKFLLEIETRYLNDSGEVENVFQLPDSELRHRIVDYLDIVTDQIGGDYQKDEDPRIYVSSKTLRGPLSDDWRNEYSAAQRAKANDKHIMCAYKICKVEFRYWGMQTKIERFIHDIALRKTMLRAHRQAWCWQDEYHGLTIDDIRALERETQRALEEKMIKFRQAEEEQFGANTNGDAKKTQPDLDSTQAQNTNDDFEHSLSDCGSTKRISWGKSRMRKGQFATWKVESLEKLRSDSSSEDEFFDAKDDGDDYRNNAASPSSMYRSSSTDLVSITSSDDYHDCSTPPLGKIPGHFVTSFDQKLKFYRQLYDQSSESPNIDAAAPDPSSQSRCRTALVFLVLHGGSLLETGQDLTTKYADLTTLRMTFDRIAHAHYPAAADKIALRLVPCPPVCADALNTLSSLSPYCFDVQSPGLGDQSTQQTTCIENLALGAIPILAAASHEYKASLLSVIGKCNEVYNKFVKSEEGNGFNGQVCLVADCMGSMFAYDILTHLVTTRNNSHNSSLLGSDPEMDDVPVFRKSHLETIKQHSHSNPDISPTDDMTLESDFKSRDGHVSSECSEQRQRNSSTSSAPFQRNLSLPASRHLSFDNHTSLDFDVSDCFLLGSPLALVLAYRRVLYGQHKWNTPKRPMCLQMYNLFHLSDPSAGRLEPLLMNPFKFVPPMKVARYNKYPLGDGDSLHLVETLQTNSHLLIDGDGQQGLDCHVGPTRRVSSISMVSQCSGLDVNLSNIAAATKIWWGMKRIDYALYCPEALHSFPTNTLPCLMHASYWESTDAVSFMLRQTVRHDCHVMRNDATKEAAVFTPSQPREKWLKRRTTIKLRNVSPNHRANDVILVEDVPQVLAARFMYGPLDVVSLSGEKVDVHIMNQPPGGEWVYFGTAVTDSSGRLTYTISEEQRLTMGMYPVKMVVRGDHTYADFYLAVLPPKTDCVIFSIDGSFTASVSIMGKDPKVRAGAVDVVRYWQDLGYLIIYVTARPDMQQKMVVDWLAQHNFPHGMVSFMDGLSADPLRQKMNYLKSLVNDVKVVVRGAYGSSKDIWVYQNLGLPIERIFVVGRASKKQQCQATILMDGYASHLNDLTSFGGAKPVLGNARLVIRRGCFGLPGQFKRNKSTKKLAKRTASLPPLHTSGPAANDYHFKHETTIEEAAIGVDEAGNTVVNCAGPAQKTRVRGTSPRTKHLPRVSYESKV